MKLIESSAGTVHAVEMIDNRSGRARSPCGYGNVSIEELVEVDDLDDVDEGDLCELCYA